MSILYIDFETKSSVDIRKAGADVYARHRSTDVMCMGFALDDGPVQLWTPFEKVKIPTADIIVAHNASFELAIWNNVCVKKYGWPKLDPRQVQCTMAMAYAMALPGALEDAAPAAGLSVMKDTVGHRVMLQLSKPRTEHEDGAVTWWNPYEVPEKFQKLYDYCKQDIVVERDLYKRLMKLSPSEQRLWILDRTINDRGVQIDVDAARKAIELVNAEEKRLNLELRDVTGGAVATCSAVGQLTDYLKWNGVEAKGVAKSDITELLSRTDLKPSVRRALELRQEAARSSTKKLVSMLSGVCDDGRVRGLFQYHGAGATGRFAGRRIQPQNLPRPKLKQQQIEEVFQIIGAIE